MEQLSLKKVPIGKYRCYWYSATQTSEMIFMDWKLIFVGAILNSHAYVTEQTENDSR